jgi:hypothetical protein
MANTKNSELEHYSIVALKGIGMGAANVVPGVSGGTIALMTGIFGELIDSLNTLMSTDFVENAFQGASSRILEVHSRQFYDGIAYRRDHKHFIIGQTYYVFTGTQPRPDMGLLLRTHYRFFSDYAG